MARNASTFAKRQREMDIKAKREEKAARAAERRASAPSRDNNGEDPDLAGIVAGPQPVLED